MFTVEELIDRRWPDFGRRHRWLRTPLLAVLRLLFHESRFRQFGEQYPHLDGIDFVDKALEYFDFSYTVRSDERERIPATGPVVIVANHPIGSLDGLALLRLVSEVRPDVKAVANELLMAIAPLHPLLLPVDALQGRTARENLRRIEAHLGDGGALVIFPAGEVSRLGARGVRDGAWRSGFLRMARRANADIVPVYVDGRNSAFFYAVSLLARPLSTLLLIREMFRQARNSVGIRIGRAIPPACQRGLDADDTRLAKRFRGEVYALARPQARSLFPPAPEAIAHPENRQLLRRELRATTALGETRDGKRIALCRDARGTAVLREIGRLREIAFRAVGEGSGARRDIDRFDPHYEHIVLWDDHDLEVVGAYRLVHAGHALARHGPGALYTGTLFEFGPAMDALWPQACELGRSFVQPRYWGRRGLDYLWYGIGAWLGTQPEVRWLFGPVSISNSYPAFARELLVGFYRHYFPPAAPLARARRPCVRAADDAGHRLLRHRPRGGFRAPARGAAGQRPAGAGAAEAVHRGGHRRRRGLPRFQRGSGFRPLHRRPDPDRPRAAAARPPRPLPRRPLTHERSATGRTYGGQRSRPRCPGIGHVRGARACARGGGRSGGAGLYFAAQRFPGFRACQAL